MNCVQKYNGKRNFFRKETKLCEPVHECHTSKDDEGLPTTVYLFIKCISLRYHSEANTNLCDHHCFSLHTNKGFQLYDNALITISFVVQAFDKDHNKCKSLIQKELTKDEEQHLKKNVETHMEASEKAKFKTVGLGDPVINISCFL